MSTKLHSFHALDYSGKRIHHVGDMNALVTELVVDTQTVASPPVIPSSGLQWPFGGYYKVLECL